MIDRLPIDLPELAKRESRRSERLTDSAVTRRANTSASVRLRFRPPPWQVSRSFFAIGRRCDLMRIAGIALLINMLLLAVAVADLSPDDRFPELSLPDQHGASHAVGPDTRLILFAADKPASDLLNGFLQTQAADLLASNQAEYIADISSMPGLITRLIALPRMRERPYRILLAEQADQVAFIPRRPAAVTVLRLDARRVLEMHFADNEAALASLLGTAARD